MKNIQVIDGALNATFSIFQATEEEYAEIFPAHGQDIEVAEDFVKRAGKGRATYILSAVWMRPIHKRNVQGIHGTLFYDYADRAQFLPQTKREIDRDPAQLNEAERTLYDRLRGEDG